MVPLVALDVDPSHVTWSVGMDHEAGARLATQHLIELGHRTIAHVAGPRDWYQAEARDRGWRAAMAAAGLPADRHSYGDWSPASGYRQGRRLAADPRVSAVFAANDQMSIGVLRAMAEAGRRVPEDVSVVGFDDIPESEFLTPPLTTIRQDFTVLGQAALRLLVGAMSKDFPPEAQIVPPKLVQRKSTGRLR
jgi:DNA-binding LacI/PurR family transcriptional regulator